MVLQGEFLQFKNKYNPMKLCINGLYNSCLFPPYSPSNQAVREDRMPGGRNSGAVYNLYKVPVNTHITIFLGYHYQADSELLFLGVSKLI
jgi:hypothetical protein